MLALLEYTLENDVLETMLFVLFFNRPKHVILRPERVCSRTGVSAIGPFYRRQRDRTRP
jgi:hypothetical protein